MRIDGENPEVDVALTVTNSGNRSAIETVQLYVTDPKASVYRPEQELRGFARVSLEPGESTQVTISLGRR